MPEDKPTSRQSADVLAEEAAAAAVDEQLRRDEQLQTERAERVKACQEARQQAVDMGMRRCGNDRGKVALADA